MMKKNSLTIKIWLYFISFASILLFFLYVFQVLLLPTYYEYVTKKEIVKTGNAVKKIMKENEDYTDKLNELSYSTGICVEIYENGNNIYTNNFLHRGCLFNLDETKEKIEDKEYLNKRIPTQENVDVYKTTLKNDFISQAKDKNTLIVENEQIKNKTILYGLNSSDNKYIFLNTSLEPIENSISILKSEFIYIILGVFIASFIISYIISKIISKPIIEISDKAKKLATGKYDMTFRTNVDIKEINELEDTLNYVRDELENTDNLRRDLMANVSHDLKTPLTMIKAYAEMNRDIKLNKEKTNNNLNVIIEECDRLNNLVNDILELSKIQSNINIINKEKVDMVKLIKNVLKRYDFLIEKENYNFIFDCNEKIIVNIDKQKMEQVIYNLINNAIKYTGKDKKVEIKLLKEDNKLKVSVIDTGKGIDKKDIKYIWDKYYKVEKKYQRNVVGTGLGLNIVKNILEQHKFDYGVESRKLVGTEFYFYICL